MQSGAPSIAVIIEVPTVYEVVVAQTSTCAALSDCSKHPPPEVLCNTPRSVSRILSHQHLRLDVHSLRDAVRQPGCLTGTHAESQSLADGEGVIMPKRFLDRQLRRALLGGMLAMFAASVVQAQTQPHYLSLTYYQTLPGKAPEFRTFAETDLSKIGQSGVDEGLLDAYYVMRLTAPYTSSSDYNYVTAVWYKGRPSLAPLDMKLWEARVEKAGFSSYQQYTDKRDSLSKVVRSAWRTTVARIGDIHAGNYLRSAAYQVEPEYREEMAQFLQEDTLPIAQGRIDGGSLQGWVVTRPAAATMSDDEAGFSYSVFNVLKDSDTLMAGPGTLTEEQFKKAVPGKTYPAYLNVLNRLNAHRKAVMTRIYEVVTAAGTPPKSDTLRMSRSSGRNVGVVADASAGAPAGERNSRPLKDTA